MRDGVNTEWGKKEGIHIQRETEHGGRCGLNLNDGKISK